MLFIPKLLSHINSRRIIIPRVNGITITLGILILHILHCLVLYFFIIHYYKVHYRTYQTSLSQKLSKQNLIEQENMPLGNVVGQNMRDIWLNLEVRYNKHFMIEYCSKDVPDHESK